MTSFLDLKSWQSEMNDKTIARIIPRAVRFCLARSATLKSLLARKIRSGSAFISYTIEDVCFSHRQPLGLVSQKAQIGIDKTSQLYIYKKDTKCGIWTFHFLIWNKKIMEKVDIFSSKRIPTKPG